MKIENYGWSFSITTENAKKVLVKSWADVPDASIAIEIRDHTYAERIFIFNKQKQVEISFYENRQKIFMANYPSLDFKIVNPKIYIYDCLIQALDIFNKRLITITDQFDTFKNNL